MTTPTIQFANEYLQHSSATTTSSERAFKIFGSTNTNASPRPTHPRETSLDDFLDELGPAFEKEVDAQGTWVADTLYPGEVTLATLRLRAGLSQKALAERCGWKQPMIARYETGGAQPSVSNAIKIAKALGVTLNEVALAFDENIEAHEI